MPMRLRRQRIINAVVAHLRDEITHDECIEMIVEQGRTHDYAKRLIKYVLTYTRREGQ